MTPSSVLHRENFLSIFWMYTTPECKKQYAHPICGSDSGSPVCCVALRLCGVLILHSPSLWLLETSPPKAELCWSWLISLSWHTVPPHWHNWKGIGRWQRAENKSPEWLRNGNCGKYTAESACCVLGSLKRSLLPVSLGSGAVLSNYKIFPGLCRPPQLVSVQLLMELGAELNWRIDPGRWLG